MVMVAGRAGGSSALRADVVQTWRGWCLPTSACPILPEDGANAPGADVGCRVPYPCVASDGSRLGELDVDRLWVWGADSASMATREWLEPTPEQPVVNQQELNARHCCIVDSRLTSINSGSEPGDLKLVVDL